MEIILVDNACLTTLDGCMEKINKVGWPVVET